MLEKARKASIEDRIGKRLESCLGKSTFRPTSFIRFLYSVLLLPRRTLVPLLLAATLSYRPLPISSGPSLSRGHVIPFHVASLPRHQGPSHTFDDSFVPAFL